MKKLQLILSLLLFTRTARAANDTIRIAISKIHKRGYDTIWLNHFAKNMHFINLYDLSVSEACKQLKLCNALLVTGGQDIDPGWYHKENELAACGDLDKERDTLEITAIKLAMQLQMPVLGICRGEQILNVANGGSLIVDIPRDIGNNVQHNTVKNRDASHMVRIDRNSQLYNIIKEDSGVVNSFHHQCVERTVVAFNGIARSNDGVIEAIELADKNSFVFGVQWHPERMPIKSAFSWNIGKAFIDRAIQNSEARMKH